MENKIIEVNMMLVGLSKIFQSDLRKILLYSCGVDIRNSKKISKSPKDFFLLKRFYLEESKNHIKNTNKTYDYYEHLIKKDGKDSLVNVVHVKNNVKIKNWEGITVI